MHDLIVDVTSLKEVMELSIKSDAIDVGKWVSWKRHLLKYNELARIYRDHSGERIPVFGGEEKEIPPNWIGQKEIFEKTYASTVELYGKLTRRKPTPAIAGLENLLHPVIQQVSMKHYNNGDFRNSVVDAITSLFDKIRERTDLKTDGPILCDSVFPIDKALLIFSEIDSESGRNDQIGHMEILKGFYRGGRNAHSHSLIHNLDAIKAAQYLVLASLLMRRLIDAVPRPPK